MVATSPLILYRVVYDEQRAVLDLRAPRTAVKANLNSVSELRVLFLDKADRRNNTTWPWMKKEKREAICMADFWQLLRISNGLPLTLREKHAIPRRGVICSGLLTIHSIRGYS